MIGRAPRMGSGEQVSPSAQEIKVVFVELPSRLAMASPISPIRQTTSGISAIMG